jgi:hypothetical protein
VKQIRKRLTYANVMSSIAVFFVLGGATAFAASKITSKQLAPNSVTTAKIKKSSVTTSKIKDASITTTKVADGAITGAKLNLGSLGKVPSAASADTAKNANTANVANSANSVNGQTAVKIFKTLTAGQSEVTVATVAGFTIKATCESTNADVLITTPTGPGTVIESGGIPGSGANKTTGEYESTKPGETGDIRLDELTEGGEDATYGVSSVSAATSDGNGFSGVIGYDYKTFDNTPEETCIVYGHLLAG